MNYKDKNTKFKKIPERNLPSISSKLKKIISLLGGKYLIVMGDYCGKFKTVNIKKPNNSYQKNDDYFEIICEYSSLILPNINHSIRLESSDTVKIYYYSDSYYECTGIIQMFKTPEEAKLYLALTDEIGEKEKIEWEA